MRIRKSEYAWTMVGVFSMGVLFSWGLFGPWNIAWTIGWVGAAAIATTFTGVIAVFNAYLGRRWQLRDQAIESRRRGHAVAYRVLPMMTAWHENICGAEKGVHDGRDFSMIGSLSTWSYWRKAVEVPPDLISMVGEFWALGEVGDQLHNLINYSESVVDRFDSKSIIAALDDSPSALANPVLRRFAGAIGKQRRRIEKVIHGLNKMKNKK